MFRNETVLGLNERSEDNHIYIVLVDYATMMCPADQ
jgi:hypothetical protein